MHSAAHFLKVKKKRWYIPAGTFLKGYRPCTGGGSHHSDAHYLNSQGPLRPAATSGAAADDTLSNASQVSRTRAAAKRASRAQGYVQNRKVESQYTGITEVSKQRSPGQTVSK